MKPGEVWKSKQSMTMISFKAGVISEELDDPRNVVILPDAILLRSVNSPPPHSVTAVAYPVVEKFETDVEWGFTPQELVTYYQKDWTIDEKG